MPGDNEATSSGQARWPMFRDILSFAAMLAFAVFIFTQGSVVVWLMDKHMTACLVFGWVLAMLSYHQDAKRHGLWWAVWSQIFAIVCLIAMVVFGFKCGRWLNFLIVPPLALLHVQFTKRWWARPGAWW